ncbi:hypothetical protein ABEB36_005504 [Hypothenemus hampei]|uniref:Uncharacterized protein n=1 Tax=Hypothenemus hampei TaxID=57062 RepID=A0ABD1EYJ5_HYPHA
MPVQKTIFIFSLCFIRFLHVHCDEPKNKLLRRKRYVVFPEGAAFSAILCLTFQMGITGEAQIFTEAINWGLIYDLPNDTKPFYDYYKAAQKRRNRRDLYGKVETVLTSMGYNGRTCVLRSLCEASDYFKLREDSLVHHILGLFFRFPTEPISWREPDEHKIYHWASLVGKEHGEDRIGKCSEIFQCPFSLIQMALGYFSDRSPFGS